MKKSILIKITNCLDCPFHRIEHDPDPDDWFNDDDKKVLCEKAELYITRCCRPHHLRDECNIPDWCPWAKELRDDTNN